MSDDHEIIQTIQRYCKDEIFDKFPSGKWLYDKYQASWIRKIESSLGKPPSDEQVTLFTTQSIQRKIQGDFGSNNVDSERKVSGSSELRFDLWNRTERTAFEICLGAIKNEFEKDILKGILDNDTIRLVILYRDYKFGQKNTIFDARWFEQPAHKEFMERARLLKLRVEAVPLMPRV